MATPEAPWNMRFKTDPSSRAESGMEMMLRMTCEAWALGSCARVGSRGGRWGE